MIDICPNCGDKQHNVTVIDDELCIFNCDYEWRYLAGSRVVHAIAGRNEEINSSMNSFCGRAPRLWMDWYGTGSQEERDKLRRFPECRLCISFLKNSAKLRKRN